MGLGKTVTTATHMEALFDTLEVTRVLVISTKRINETVWPEEFRKWDHLRWIPIRNIEGSQKQRAQMLREPYYGVETITFEKITHTFRDVFDKNTELPWDMIVIDESAKLKATGTQRFHALRPWAARDAFPKYLYELCGSPAPSGLLNLWAPMFLLDGGARLGKTYLGFRDRWFEAGYMGWKYEPQEGAEEEIYAAVADIALPMKAEDWLELPPLIVRDVVVDLPPQCRNLYRKLEDQMYIQLQRGEVEAVNAAVLTGKCRQMANGAMYLNGETHEFEEVHQAKMDALDEIVTDAAGHNIIVVYQFTADAERIMKAYPKAVNLTKAKDAAKTQAAWNRGEIPMLILHPQSGGHGLNLQEGGRRMVFFGCPWSLDQYTQSHDRIAGGLRRTESTFVYRILAANTIDYTVVESLETNRTIQDVLMDRVKDHRIACTG